jgi:branched-chain amino acid transport system substrate-binding protein
MKLRRRQFLHLAAGAAVIPALSRVAFAQSVPIKVGFSMALTGSVAPNGKQLLIALEIWRDDVNAKGGLLGRPVELVYFDDQSNPSNVPAIYSKLLSVDKVDLILGPYATNMAAAAMPLIIDKGKTTISILAVGVSEQFDYPK